MSREEFVARLVRAGELEVSGENPDEVDGYFSPDFTFHEPGGSEAGCDGLQEYFPSWRSAFDNRKITRGIVVVEGNYIARQTTMEGDFVREFTQSPVGSLPPNGQHVVFELINIFRYDDEGRIVDEYVQIDNHTSSSSSAPPAAEPTTSDSAVRVPRQRAKRRKRDHVDVTWRAPLLAIRGAMAELPC